MKLENDKLIAEFHKLNKDKYPDIDLEQAKEICNGPWKFIKQEMESGELPTIRLKYFGTFQVYQGRAKNMLDKLKERFRYNKVERSEFYRIKEMLEKFISNYESTSK